MKFIALALLAVAGLAVAASTAEASGPRFRRSNVVVVQARGHHVGAAVVVQSRSGFFGRRSAVIVHGR